MADTYTLISSQTLSGSASSVTFSSIPQTYTDLLLVASARTDRSYFLLVDSILVQPNASATGYTTRNLLGTGSATQSNTDTAALQLSAGATTSNETANTFGNGSCYIPNYTGSAYKSASLDGVGENNATEAWAGFTASLWSNTAAITSLKLLPYGGANFVQYSTFYLYGIKNS